MALIMIIGAVTTFTDLRSKKIYNQHLIIAAVVGVIVIAYAVVFRHEHLLYHIINGLIAGLIGFLLYRSALWRGGDAKLFTLYAFLMPPPVYDALPFPGVVNLFACSFIAGMVILTPAFIKDIIINRKTITTDLFSRPKRWATLQAIVSMALYCWILFPLYHVARITNPIIMLTIPYLVFNWKYYLKEDVEKHYIIGFFKRGFIKISFCIVLGLALHLYLFPESLSYQAIVRQIMMITLSGILSVCIRTIFDHFKDYQQRVPFAPLLFIGCVLSYTPFLKEVTHMLVRWSVFWKN